MVMFQIMTLDFSMGTNETKISIDMVSKSPICVDGNGGNLAPVRSSPFLNQNKLQAFRLQVKSELFYH
jgi:hypothetical protein